MCAGLAHAHGSASALKASARPRAARYTQIITRSRSNRTADSALRTQAPRPGPPRPPRSSQSHTHLAARTQDTPHMKNEHPHVDCWPPRSPTTKQCSMLQNTQMAMPQASSLQLRQLPSTYSSKCSNEIGDCRLGAFAEGERERASRDVSLSGETGRGEGRVRFISATPPPRGVLQFSPDRYSLKSM